MDTTRALARIDGREQQFVIARKSKRDLRLWGRHEVQRRRRAIRSLERQVAQNARRGY